MKKYFYLLITAVMIIGIISCIENNSPTMSKINTHVEISDYIKRNRFIDMGSDWKAIIAWGVFQKKAYINPLGTGRIGSDTMTGIQILYVLKEEGDKRLICSSSQNIPKLLESRMDENGHQREGKEISLNPTEQVKYALMCNKKGSDLLQSLKEWTEIQ